MRRALLFCVLMGMAAPGGATMDPHVVVVTSDPNAGNVDVLETTAPWTPTHDLEPVGPFALVRHYHGLHYVVNPLGDTIQVIDPATFDTIRTLSVGAGSHPRDILPVAPDRAYVTRYDSALLLEIDPVTGVTRDTIDLGPLADADGLPEMSMMAIDGNHLYVQLQRIDRDVTGQAVLPSLLAVVDIRTNQIIDAAPGIPGLQGVALAGTLPDFRMHVDHVGRSLFVCAPGKRLKVSGGIEEIDLDTMQTRGFILSEEDVGADLGGFVMVSPDRGYVIAHTDIVASSHLTSFHRDPNVPGQGEFYTSLWIHNDAMAWDAATAQLFFPEPATTPPGIHVFDTVTNTRLTTTPVATSLPPYDLLVARDVTPGEAVNLTVIRRAAGSGSLEIAYRQACGAENHNIVYGPLQDVGGHGYSGQVCGIGASGWFAGFDPGPGSYFFVVVGTDGGGREGSYGLTSAGAERPEDLIDPNCAFTQDLTSRCVP